MLQWMGGSRRKVTATRKTTQKRQRQYFEQRKRQQQQQTAGLESSTDGTDVCFQDQSNGRSLDILSWLNLSTVAKECKSSCPTTRESSNCDALRESHQTTQCLPTSRTKEVTQLDPLELREARTSSDFHVGTAYPTKVLSGATCSHDKGSTDVDLLNMPSEHQLSVLELLNDDGQHINSEDSSVHEAHVAFSIEGLGKVGTETPVHSPQQPGRTFSYGCSSPSKLTRRNHSSENLTGGLDNLGFQVKELDVTMRDTDMPFCPSYLEQSFCSTGLMDSFGSPKPKISSVKRSLQYNDKGNVFNNSFANEDFDYSSTEKNEYLWNAPSNFLDDNFLGEKEYDKSWQNWPSQMDARLDDYFSNGDTEKLDFAFEVTHLRKKRTTAEATRKFNILEPQSRYYKHHTSDNDFPTSDGAWYSTLGINSDIKDVNSQPEWSSFAADDAKDSLSLRSEESCSSSAVRGDKANKPATNPMARQSSKRQHTDSRGPANKHGVKSIYDEETQCRDRAFPWSDKNTDRTGNYTRMNSLFFKPTHYSNMTSRRNFGSDESWLSDRGLANCKLDPEFNFLTRGGASSSCLWTEDPFDECAFPELHNPKSAFEGSIRDNPAEHSPFENPSFSSIQSGSSNPNLAPFSTRKYGAQDSFQVLGCHADREFLDRVMKESVVSKGEEKKLEESTYKGKVELQEEAISNASNILLSENGKPMDDSDSEDYCSDYKETKGETPEIIEARQATCSSDRSEHGEETSLSVEINNKEECQNNDAQTSIPCQNICKEIEDSRLEERKVESKASCQVMMLERYVLQLLCVEVLKEAKKI